MAETLKPTPQLIEESMPSPRLDFGKFSEMPEYIEVNRTLIQESVKKIPSNFVHVDVACGTGMVEKLMKEEAEKLGKSGKIIGVDPNATSLEIARNKVTSTPHVSIKFIEGLGQSLKQILNSEITNGVDSISIHDALHEIWDNKDKTDIINSMAGVLKPGGYLTFNSAFTTIANGQDGPGWGRWKLLSMEKLAGQRIRRNKDAKAMPVLTTQEYKNMIENAGLDVIRETTTPIALTREALIAISRYPAFIEGTFADMPEQEKYSTREKSNVLVKIIEELGVPSLTKVWYDIVARKPQVA